MHHLLPNESIKAELLRIVPRRIAVAYIGHDWEQLVDKYALRQVILSPTIGSNPWAIIELQKTIGWNNLFFLDELHAKVYLGETEASIGSFNLSLNGFEENRLIEFGVLVKSPNQLNELNVIFDRWLELAKSRYPDIASKKEKISKLIAQWNEATSNGTLSPKSIIPAFKDYRPLTRTDFTVSWWIDEGASFDKRKLAEELPELQEFPDPDLGHIASNWTNCSNEDPVKKDTWILFWRARRDGLPHKTKNPEWLYVHDRIQNAVKDPKYGNLLLERKDRPKPPPPFSLDSKVTIAALKKILSLEKFNNFRYADENSTWSSAATHASFLQFIEMAQEEEERNTSSI